MEKDEFKAKWLSLDEKFYRVALVILKSGDDARDALQDLYVRLWGMRRALDAVASPLSYGITVLRNICIDRLRSSERRGGRAGDMEAAQRMAGEVADGSAGAVTEARLIGREAAARLREVVRNLPRIQRTVVELRLFRQLDYAEIARRTALSEGNVRVLLSRARRTIRDGMREYI